MDSTGKTAQDMIEKSWASSQRIADETIEKNIKEFEEIIKSVENCIDEASNDGETKASHDVTARFSNRIIRIFEARGFYIKRDYWIPLIWSRKSDMADDYLCFSWRPKDVNKLFNETKTHRWLRLHNPFATSLYTQAIICFLIFLAVLLSGLLIFAAIAKVFGIC